MTTASIRESDWDIVDVSYRNRTIKYIYRREQGKLWVPWLVLAPSAALERVGKSGLGVYVAKHTRKDTVLGRYEGRRCAHYDTREEAMSSREAQRLVRRGGDKVVALRSRDGAGYDVVDGSTAQDAPPCIPYVNDRRGTRCMPNCVLTEHGYLKVIRASMPAFNLNATIADNNDSECRIDYGKFYWDLIDMIGSEDAPLECD